MVKAQRTSCSPPSASLSLASTLLKPCKRPPFSSSVKRPPLGHSQLMEPSSSPSSISEILDNPHTIDNLPSPHTDWQSKSKSAGTPSSAGEDATSVNENQGSMCSRQRFQHHRMLMSGKVIIPDSWGREQQLQEWVSHGIVEDALQPAGLMSARTALVSECQRRGNNPVQASPPLSANVEVS